MSISDVAWRRLEFALDRLVSDPYYLVRMKVARNGYGLEVLKDDPDKKVRELARYLSVKERLI